MSRRTSRIGSLTIVCGSMFAGKSEELIRRARRALYARRKVQVFKPSIDDRYHQTMVVTHMGVQHEAIPVRGLKELRASIDPKTEVVCIEEVQFFEPAIVGYLVELA